jgi:2,3-dihydroxybenzoate decarboxylase
MFMGVLPSELVDALDFRFSCAKDIRRNFLATTADACQSEALVCAIQALGAERIMSSVDYPLEDSAEAARFIEAAPISEQDRELICWKNAALLLRL